MRKPVNTHDFGATYQEGIVTQLDPKTHRIKAKIPALEDFETAWLPFVTLQAGGNQFYALPDVGALVAILLDARGEGGCVIGCLYNEADPVPVSNSEIWVQKFSNGTEIAHNRKTGDLTIHTTGNVIVHQSNVNVNGGTVTVVKGDVIADGISLKNHTHTEQGDGRPTSKAQ